MSLLCYLILTVSAAPLTTEQAVDTMESSVVVASSYIVVVDMYSSKTLTHGCPNTGFWGAGNDTDILGVKIVTNSHLEMYWPGHFILATSL